MILSIRDFVVSSNNVTFAFIVQLSVFLYGRAQYGSFSKQKASIRHDITQELLYSGQR